MLDNARMPNSLSTVTHKMHHGLPALPCGDASGVSSLSGVNSEELKSWSGFQGAQNMSMECITHLSCLSIIKQEVIVTPPI